MESSRPLQPLLAAVKRQETTASCRTVDALNASTMTWGTSISAEGSFLAIYLMIVSFGYNKGFSLLLLRLLSLFLLQYIETRAFTARFRSALRWRVSPG